VGQSIPVFALSLHAAMLL